METVCIKLKIELDTIKDPGKSCNLPYILEQKIFTVPFFFTRRVNLSYAYQGNLRAQNFFYENDSIDLNSNFYDDGQKKIDMCLELT